MFARLIARGEARGQAAAARAAARLAAEITVPGVRAEAGPDGVTLSGRRLRRRLVDTPELRWIGRWVR